MTQPPAFETLTVAQALALDDAEVVEGYRDGRRQEPMPGANRSVAYRHGWRCGSNDAAGVSDAFQREVARAFIAREAA